LLGIIAPADDGATQDPFPLGPSDGVPDEWYAWYRAWRATGSRGLAPRIARHYGGYILYAGRWLARRHVDVVSPEQWTEELALATCTAVLEETNDVFVSASGRRNLQGQRLRRRTSARFRTGQFSAVQALAFLWVSTARRPNELLRLRADCVRTQWEPEMSDESGDRLPPGADVVGNERGAKVSYLHVPSSKYGGPGWIWIQNYTADAIARWRAERGQTRLTIFDQKDREFAQLLFVHRGKGMGFTFLNRRLIPLLCWKAGVDPRDAEGAYTAHRGRSARISMLHACGLELEDLAAYAIHKNTQTIKK
jgi:hypothetical protein